MTPEVGRFMRAATFLIGLLLAYFSYMLWQDGLGAAVSLFFLAASAFITACFFPLRLVMLTHGVLYVAAFIFILGG